MYSKLVERPAGLIGPLRGASKDQPENQPNLNAPNEMTTASRDPTALSPTIATHDTFEHIGRASGNLRCAVSGLPQAKENNHVYTTSCAHRTFHPRAAGARHSRVRRATRGLANRRQHRRNISAPETSVGPVVFMCLASTVKSAPWLSMKTAISSWVAASRKPGVSAPTISRDGMATPGLP